MINEFMSSIIYKNDIPQISAEKKIHTLLMKVGYAGSVTRFGLKVGQIVTK